MKRQAEGAIEKIAPASKRRFFEMLSNTMPGAWPEDPSLDNVTYSSLLASPPRKVQVMPSPWRSQKSKSMNLPFPTLQIQDLIPQFNPLRILAQAFSLIKRRDATPRLTAAEKAAKVAEEEARQQAEQQRRNEADIRQMFTVPEEDDTEATPVPRARQHMPANYIPEYIRVRRYKARGLPEGWGSAGYDPTTIIATPARTSKTFKSPARWSPYHYEHGIRRPEKSILRSSRTAFAPFERKLFIPSPQKYVDEDESPIDQEGDLVMLEADVPKKSSKVSFAQPRHSWLNGEKFDSVNGAPKKFFRHLGINEPLGPSFTGYRDIKPEFDPDESFLDSPKPAGFDEQQKFSPSKDYHGDFDHTIETTISEWYRDIYDRQDPEEGLSKAMQERYAQAREERRLEEMRQRHAKEQAIRDELARKRKAEAEEKLAIELARQEEERIKRDTQAAAEAAETERRSERLRIEELQRALGRAAKRSVVPDQFTMNAPIVQRVLQALQNTNPGTQVIEKGQISRHDLGTLLPAGHRDASSGWLNDAIVNTTLNHLVLAANKKLGHQKTEPAPFWAFNSAWFSAIGNGSGISRWAAKRGVNLGGKNLLKAKKILFPVCLSSHWTVTILDVENRAIESMNSLNTNEDSSYNLGISKKIMSFVRHELGADFFEPEWRLRRSVTCQQANASDCGVFTIMNSIARIKNIPTWSMREQVVASRMGTCRWYIAALLFNEGYVEGSQLFDIHIDTDRRWAGAFIDDPDYKLES